VEYVTGGTVQFASASEPGSGKARKRVERPRRMAVAGKKGCDSGKRVALAYKQVIQSNLRTKYGLDWTGSGRADCTAIPVR